MLSQRIKSHPKIFAVIFGSASYTLGIITSSGINTYFHYYDVSIEAASQAEVLKAEHRNNLIREIAEGNEAIMDAETKFLMASEFEAMRGALGLIAQASGNSPEAATADFVKTMERLGLSPKDAVFAESSNQYSNVKQKVIGTLASVDLYFSDEVSQYATEYRAYIRAPNIDEKRRMNYWAEIANDILRNQTPTEKFADIFSAAYASSISYNNKDLSNISYLYNRMYNAMCREARRPQ